METSHNLKNLHNLSSCNVHNSILSLRPFPLVLYLWNVRVRFCTSSLLLQLRFIIVTFWIYLIMYVCICWALKRIWNRTRISISNCTFYTLESEQRYHLLFKYQRCMYTWLIMVINCVKISINFTHQNFTSSPKNVEYSFLGYCSFKKVIMPQLFMIR